MFKCLKKLAKLTVSTGVVCAAAAVTVNLFKKCVNIEHTGNTDSADTDNFDEASSPEEETSSTLFEDDAISSDEAAEPSNRHYVNIQVDKESNDLNISIDMEKVKTDAVKLKDNAVSFTRNLVSNVKSTASHIQESTPEELADEAKEKAEEIWDDVKEKAEEVWDDVKEKTENIVSEAEDASDPSDSETAEDSSIHLD